jgi:hypothetical protein
VDQCLLGLGLLGGPAAELSETIGCYSFRPMKTYNQPYTSLSMRRRYEVWFLRLGLSDGSGAWWFRYLLMNPGRDGCPDNAQGQPVQVWATWFPRQGKPETWIQGFPLQGFRLSMRGSSPFSFEMGENRIGENECRGRIEVGGHRLHWDLRYRSSFRMELSSKGWIGFSRTPHSDAVFSGEITLDGRTFRGEPLGYGMQGHNCGFRHRHLWTWTHLHLPGVGGDSSSFEALVYEMPFGLVFRMAVLWHRAEKYILSKLSESVRDVQTLAWKMKCSDGRGAQVDVEIAGRPGFVHRLSYVKTDCSGQFEVANDSLAVARLVVRLRGRAPEELTTHSGAVLEMAGG